MVNEQEKEVVQCGRDVAVKCWFKADGTPMPLMFKIMADDDVVAVNNIEVLNAESQEEFSAIIWKFRCRAPIHDKMVYFFLTFHSKWCNWRLFM